MDNQHSEDPTYLSVTLEFPLDILIPWLTYAYWEDKDISEVLDEAFRKHILNEPSAHVPVPPERQADFDHIIQRAKARREAGEGPAHMTGQIQPPRGFE